MKHKIRSLFTVLLLTVVCTACSTQTKDTESNLGNAPGNELSETQNANEDSNESESSSVSESSVAEDSETIDSTSEPADANAPLYTTVNKSDYEYADLEWSYADGVLTFTGEGKMPDGSSVDHPWNVHADETTSVVIGEGLVSVGKSSFYRFSNLSSVTLPSTLLFIETEAFGNCGALTSITLPEGLIELGYGAFYGCDALSSINLPSTLVKIDEDAFFCCGSLSAITFPDSLRSIGKSAFYSTGLTEVTIPEGVVEIGSSAFGSNYSLTTAHLYSSVEDIPNIFETTPNLATLDVGPHYVLEDGILYNSDQTILIGCMDASKTSITIPESVTKIAADAFNACENLSTLTIHKNILEIGESAFLGCKALTSVSIEEGLTTVSKFAFAYCEGLTTLTFPKTVTEVGYGAFRGCTNLTEVHFDASQEAVALDTNDIPENVAVTFN